jgi:hypothetical protein
MKSMPSVFTKHIADTLEKHKPKINPPELKHQAAGRLLNWMLSYWDRPTISVRDICRNGPHPRNLKEATNAIETLAKQGWLLPIPGRQHDNRIWRIIRENK